MNRLAVLATLILTASAAFAQQHSPVAPDPKPEPTHQEILFQAVSALAGEKEACFDGRIDELEPDDESGGGVVIVAGGPGAASEPFLGRFHLLRRGAETIVMSRRRLPGIICYDDGDRCVVQATYEETPPDASKLTGELPQLVDFHRLAAASRRAKSVKSEPQGDGATRYSFALPKRFVAAAPGGIAVMAARILSIDASVTLDASRQVSAIRFSILRSDPMAAMRRRAMSGELGGGATTITVGDMDDGEPEPGSTTVVELSRGGADRSAKLGSAVAALRELLR